MIKRLMAAGVILAGLGASAVAEESAGLVTFKVLSPGLALQLAQAALRKCREQGYQTSIAIVDRFGTTQVILRDRFAGPHTPETARRKAWTAVSFRTDTLTMASQTAYADNGGVRFVADALMVGGGVPVESAGAIVAGIGISGAPGGAADDACARAAIETIVDKLEF